MDHEGSGEDASSLEGTFARLFRLLTDEGYSWGPIEPARLRSARARDRDGTLRLPSLERRFGLGLGWDCEGPGPIDVPPALLEELTELHPAVAKIGDRFVAHRHFDEHGPPVYLGAESASLATLLQERAELFAGKSVLDLGSGAGALSLVLAGLSTRVLGIELSEQATQWATASARAQGLLNVRFARARIGDPTARLAVTEVWPGPWNIAVFNPPMAVPSSAHSGGRSERPSRDGGDLGIEVPLAFLDFARQSLDGQGEVLFLATNPILRDGSAPFFERLNGWRWIERRCLQRDFNRALFRQDDYARLGIRRIELWFLHGRRLSPIR